MTERSIDDPTRARTRRRGVLGAAVVVLALLAGLVATPAGAATSDDPEAAADAGATWLEGRLTGGGGAYARPACPTGTSEADLCEHEVSGKVISRAEAHGAGQRP